MVVIWLQPGGDYKIACKDFSTIVSRRIEKAFYLDAGVKTADCGGFNNCSMEENVIEQGERRNETARNTAIPQRQLLW